MKFITIGVHGTKLESFFGALEKNGITHFCDIRMRRGMRGSAYKYANATELQERLATLDIEYRHVLELAPTRDVRDIQVQQDKRHHVSIYARTALSTEFAMAYRRERLDRFNLEEFMAAFPPQAKVVLFCVEANASACHRSLVAERLEKVTGQPVPDITPSH